MGYMVMDSIIGKLTLVEEDGFVTGVYFGVPIMDLPYHPTALLEKTQKQLLEYLEGKLKKFDLPLKPKGTEFRERVWKELLKIPYGKTISYGELAKKIGNPKSVRAVGGANNHNPISIIIPCHRVIGADGSLTGYGGGLEIKKFLLDLEKKGRA